MAVWSICLRRRSRKGQEKLTRRMATSFHVTNDKNAGRGKEQIVQGGKGVFLALALEFLGGASPFSRNSHTLRI